jgi:hypothetical protein
MLFQERFVDAPSRRRPQDDGAVEVDVGEAQGELPGGTSEGASRQRRDAVIGEQPARQLGAGRDAARCERLGERTEVGEQIESAFGVANAGAGGPQALAAPRAQRCQQAALRAQRGGDLGALPIGRNGRILDRRAGGAAGRRDPLR